MQKRVGCAALCAWQGCPNIVTLDGYYVTNMLEGRPQPPALADMNLRFGLNH